MADRKTSSAFPQMRGEPETTYSYSTRTGDARELQADADGIVQPETAEDLAFLRGFPGVEAVDDDDETSTSSRKAAGRARSGEATKVASTRRGDDAGDTADADAAPREG